MRVVAKQIAKKRQSVYQTESESKSERERESKTIQGPKFPLEICDARSVGDIGFFSN